MVSMVPNEEKNQSVYFVFSEKETCEKLSKIFGIQDICRKCKSSEYEYVLILYSMCGGCGYSRGCDED